MGDFLPAWTPWLRRESTCFSQVCRRLGAEPARGMPMASFRKFHERYRWGKLEADVAALEAGC